MWLEWERLPLNELFREKENENEVSLKTFLKSNKALQISWKSCRVVWLALLQFNKSADFVATNA